MHWLGPVLYELEYTGHAVLCDYKVLVRRARLKKHIVSWNPESQRLFSADCAERVLSIFEQQYPSDERPKLAIKAARDFAQKRIGVKELDAARTAAGDAAWGDAAWAAAWAAEMRWQTERLFTYIKNDV